MCPVTNFPLSSDVKIIYMFQHFLGKVVRTDFTVQECDGQTKQKINIFGSTGGVLTPCPTILSMVIEDLKHILEPLKLTYGFADKGH